MGARRTVRRILLRVGVFPWALIQTYRLLVRRIGYIKAAAVALFVAVVGTFGWLLVSPRAILPVVALVFSAVVWIWAPFMRLGAWAPRVTVACAGVAALAIGVYALGH